MQIVRQDGEAIGRHFERRAKEKGVQNILAKESWVAQEYVEPFLWDGKKWHIRLFVLASGVEPLKVWLLHEGSYIMMATANYSLDTFDKDAHITNYNYQCCKARRSEEYRRNPDRYTKAYSDLRGLLGDARYAELERDISEMVLSTLFSALPAMKTFWQ